MIVAVEILAAAQLAVISAVAVLLTVRRVAVARCDRRRERLLDRYRDSVLEFVGMDEEHPPAELRELRSDDTCSGMKVIMLTARAQDRDVDVGFSLGADDYITKPFSPQELRVRIGAHLGKR